MITPLFDEKYYFSLVEHIVSAKHSISFTVFHSNFSHRDPSCPVKNLLDKILLVSTAGVLCQCIFPSLRHTFTGFQSNIKVLNYLNRGGVLCSTFERSSIVHSKFFLIDNTYLFIGSHNLTKRSLTATVETSILVSGDPVVKAFADRFRYYLSFSKKFAPKDV